MLKAGQQFLAGPGVTTIMPSWDFETYSEAGFVWDESLQKWKSPPGCAATKRGLKAVGLRNYILHPTFDLLSIKYDLKDGFGPRHWKPSDWPRLPVDLLEHIAAGRPLKAWNSGFEFQVWNLHCVPRYGFPALRVEQTYCDMAEARAHALPGALANAGAVVNATVQKDKDGERLLKKFSQPRNPTKKDPRTRIRPEDDPVDGPKLYAYNERDIAAENEISLRTPDLSPMEREIWLFDQDVNNRGLGIDLKALDDCLYIVDAATAKYGAEFRELTEGIEVTEVERVLGWLHARGLHLDSLDEENVSAALERITALENTVEGRVLQLRQMLAASSVKKLYAFKNENNAGRLYDLYSYFAARTGRWTGNGPQPQNLYKGSFHSIEEVEKCLAAIATRCLELVEHEYGNPIEAVANCLRGLIVPAPGHDFICSDFSAIESVVTAALAGEEWRLEVFRTHGMIYEASASKTCKIPFDEFVRHKKETGKHHPLRNKIGKFTELACGFGGWVGALVNFGADEFLTEQEMKQAIIDWRAASPMIVELWGGQTRGDRWSRRPELYGLEGAIISAIKWPGQAFRYRDIAYEVKDDVLYCRVPSGGLITYHKPRITPYKRFDWSPDWEVSISYEGWNNNPKMGAIGWIRMDLYGGKATENVVQRVARDLLTNAMVRQNKAGYHIVLHSHDEPMAEVPEGWGSVEEFESFANDLPDWARTPDGKPWPVKMKGGWRGKRYGKFD